MTVRARPNAERLRQRFVLCQDFMKQRAGDRCNLAHHREFVCSKRLCRVQTRPVTHDDLIGDADACSRHQCLLNCLNSARPTKLQNTTQSSALKGDRSACNLGGCIFRS